MAQETKIEVKVEDEVKMLSSLNRLPEVILPTASVKESAEKAEVRVVTRRQGRRSTRETEATYHQPNDIEQLAEGEEKKKRKTGANYEPAEVMEWEDVGWIEKTRKERISDSIYEQDTNGTGYKVFPTAHISRLKRKFEAPFRPDAALVNDRMERFDFDEALLPEDSWLPDEEDGEYEVEQILDKKIERLANGKRVTRYHIKWKGYEETSWEPEENLSCGALLYAFDQKFRAKQRYNAMLADEEDSEEEE